MNMRNIILLFFLIVGWTTTVYAQNEQETIEVTGIVTDPKNEPLVGVNVTAKNIPCLLYTSPSPRDRSVSRMPSSA